MKSWHINKNILDTGVIVLCNYVELYEDIGMKHHEMNIDHEDYIDNYNMDIDVQSNIDAF